MTNLSNNIRSINYQIVNTDELEYFRQSKSPLFDYPFESRNLQVNSFDLYDSFSSYDPSS